MDSLSMENFFYQVRRMWNSWPLGIILPDEQPFHLNHPKRKRVLRFDYVKEIDQEGLLIKKKKYVQTLTFGLRSSEGGGGKRGKMGGRRFQFLPRPTIPFRCFARVLFER